MKNGVAAFVLIVQCLFGATGCLRQPSPTENGPHQTTVAANNKPAKDSAKQIIKIDPIVPKGGTKPESKKPEPEVNDEPWPAVSDEPPVEPKALDAKVIEAWKAAGATGGWQTKFQVFDKKPDFKYYPELLPYLALRPFKPGVVTKLPPPDEPFSLYLYNSNITDAGVKELAILKKLRKLNLVANFELTGAGFAALSALPDLRILELYQTKLNDAGLKEICQIKSLRELNIGLTQVTDAGLEHLAKLKNLKTLNLTGTKITDAGLKAIVAFASDNLKTVKLPPAVTKTAVDEAKKLRPKVSFIR